MAELLAEKSLLCKRGLEVNKDLLEEEDQIECNTVAASEILQGKVVCLFFSASWCAPCQHFVPLLKEVYVELKRRRNPLEIIFLNFDKTEDEMMSYYKEKHGDWLAVKFGDPIKEELAERYGISVIPKLIVIQPDGEIITSKGRKDVQDKGLVCMRAWQAGLNKHMNTDRGESNGNNVDNNANDNDTIDTGQA